MSKQLVVDTNVLLLASTDSGCAEIYRNLRYSCDYALLLDRHQKIWREYRTHAQRFPQSRLAELVKILLSQKSVPEQHNPTTSAGLPLAIELDSTLSAEEQLFLRNKKCPPIEPEMIGIAKEQSLARLVILGDSKARHEPIPRGYRQPGLMQELVDKFKLQIGTTDSLNWLSELDDPVPNTQESLDAFLKAKRNDTKDSVEREFIEVKCSKRTDLGITAQRRNKVMEAVCAMTNTTSGYIFVGVEDDGTIRGVTRTYINDRGDLTAYDSWDALWNGVFMSEMGKFKPRKPEIRNWYIPVANNSNEDIRVIAIRVHQQRGGTYRYKGEEFVRMGTASVKR
jgi:hypothetical protein